MSASLQKRTYALQQKQALYSITSSAHYRGKIARLFDDLHCPRKEDKRISIDEQRPHPMHRKNLREVQTPVAKRSIRQLGLPLTPKDGGQDNRQSLTDEVGPYGPHGRDRTDPAFSAKHC